jgi:ribosomal protein S18 acetylase RimI-like enzyme
MLNLRQANINEHKFLVRIDLKNDGYTVSNEVEMTEQEKDEHSHKIKRFLTDKDKGAFIFEDTDVNKQIGMIMYSIVNRDSVIPYTIYNELERGLFQKDGRFMEIFQLWVDEKYRRLGLATKLKLKLEEEAISHKVNLIYTHTEEENHHVLELNHKLGYQTVRSGPIWDDAIRISLIKKITY